ncbi:MAG TPA: tetratricopeptide repeat protein, partial [Nannocystaceae bacterium]|nr:tetratricopeptide repeat protein [Nannocystaceae bacterium]
ETCEDGAEQIDARWNDERREGLADAFARTDLPSAPQQWASVAALVDAHVDAWRAMYVDACAATHERREQSDALLDARMQCLRERADHLEALLVELEAVDVALVGKAVGAALRLPAVADCRAPPTPDRTAALEAADARVVAARAALATARARRDAGRYEAGFRAVEEAEDALGDAPFPRVHAEVQLVRARLHDAIGEHAEAESVLREVVLTATAEGDPRTAALAWIDLVEIVGLAPARSEEALAFVLATDAAIAAAGGDPVLRRQRLTAEAIVRLDKGQSREALALQDEALALAMEHEAATDSPVLAVLHTNRGNALVDLGRFAEAEAAHEEALAIDIAAFGERHPSVASDLMNLARDVGRHDLERARELAGQALAIREEFLGPESRATGEVVLTLAINARERGDLPEARALAERALATFTATLPANHMHLAAVNNELGIIANESGRQDEAIAYYREVERIARAAHGDEHPHVSAALQNRANVLRERGDASGAFALYEEALAIKEKTRGLEHPSLAPLLVARADVLEKLGRADEATTSIERALAIHRATDGGAGDIAWAESVKARVAYATAPAGSAARTGALELARRSLAKLRELDPANSEYEIAEVEAWLRVHRG